MGDGLCGVGARIRFSWKMDQDLSGGFKMLRPSKSKEQNMKIKKNWREPFCRYIITIFIGCLVSMGISNTASAFDWSIKFEPGLSIPLTDPQSHLFNFGGSATVKILFGLGEYVDLGPTAGFVGFPHSKYNLNKDLGTGWELGGGIRFKRPHNNLSYGLSAVSPWLDADALYVRTEPLNRFGFSVGTGLAFPIDENRQVWFGPFVRYSQITQPERVGYDNRDAKILTAGLSLEVGNSRAPVRAKPVEPVVVECPAVIPPKPCDPCLPPPASLPVEPKPELLTVIQFDWDDYSLNPNAVVALDKVAEVLNNNKSYDVVVEGHASSEGQTEHNQKLSKNRAEAVIYYLIAHNISNKRLTSKGFGSSVPAEDNGTLKGRQANRRVTFKIEVVSAGGVK